ncbi:MAG: glycosyltransferase [Lentisphaerae bacterium]|jgi:cellulose synthase/poly-beta-1,6-N-acetylglucosamine synthase-like glycosyltransferase|nr:glycosyltransferase [Lentisphaerota bacterium]
MSWMPGIVVGLLAYIYIGYPVVVWAMSRLRGRPIAKGEYAGGAAVLLAAHNEAEALPEKLGALVALSRDEAIREIWVGLDGCTDGTAQRLAGMGFAVSSSIAEAGTGSAGSEAGAAVRVVDFAARRGKAAVLNELMAAASEPVLVMMDARQRVEAGAITRLLENLADETVGVVSGELVYEQARGGAERGADSYWGYEKFIRSCESRWWAVPGATGALYAIRRELCEPIPEHTLVDDVLIPMRAVLKGFRCVFEPLARVTDRPTTHFEREMLRKRRTLAGIWQIGRLEPRIYSIFGNKIWFQWVSHKFLRLLTPFLVVLALISAGWLEFRHGWAGGGPVAWFSVVFWGGLAGLGLSGLAYAAGRRISSRVVGLLGAFWGVNLALTLAATDAWRGRFEPKWTRSS